MLVAVVAILESISLIASGILHVYWASGGQWGVDQAVSLREREPGDLLEEEEEPAFRPHKLITRSVGMVCFVAAGLVLTRVGIVTLPIQGGFVEYSLWALAGFFLLRAIGDFRYTGITKRVRGTTFAYWDNRVYTPMFLAFGLATIIVNLLAG